MGVVYQARDTRLGRLVALKMVLHAEYAGPAQRDRFRDEARAVARLSHPNVVQVYEVGEHAGLPYCVLEYCPRGSLAQRLAYTPLPPRDAARLVETLARAVQAAHEAGVVHRDLKPANVLLAADGTPKVADFGLAKLASGGSGLTATGVVLGTPSYMAPEQAEGKKEVGPAADVYALGAVLYECLTGRPPFRAATPLDTLRQVLGDEPVAPRRLNPQVPRDLETVCLKCLEKAPQRRYPTARELADDLGRFQRGEPVRVRPVGRLERVWRGARRRPLVSASVAATLLVCLVAAGLLAWQSAAGRQALLEAKAREDREREQAARLRLADEERAVREGLSLTGHTSAVWSCAFSRDGKRLASCGDEALKIWDLSAKRVLFSIPGCTTSADFSPDGKRLATAHWDHRVRVWDTTTGQLVFPPLRGHAAPARQVLFSPDGRSLVSVGWDGQLLLWDAAAGKQLLAVTGKAPLLEGVAFSPDGTRVACCGGSSWDTRPSGGWVQLFALPTGQEVLSLPRQPDLVRRVQFSPDGRGLATSSWDGTVRLWDAHDGRERLCIGLHTGFVGNVAFSPDGKWLATAGDDSTLKVVDVATGRQALSLGHSARVHCAVFSPDGRRLAASVGLTLKLWDWHELTALMEQGQGDLRDQ
jgi:hypothetical protein